MSKELDFLEDQFLSTTQPRRARRRRRSVSATWIVAISVAGALVVGLAIYAISTNRGGDSGDMRAIRAWFAEKWGETTYEILKHERLEKKTLRRLVFLHGQELVKDMNPELFGEEVEYIVFVRVRHVRFFGIPRWIQVWSFYFSPNGRLISGWPGGFLGGMPSEIPEFLKE